MTNQLIPLASTAHERKRHYGFIFIIVNYAADWYVGNWDIIFFSKVLLPNPKYDGWYYGRPELQLQDYFQLSTSYIPSGQLHYSYWFRWFVCFWSMLHSHQNIFSVKLIISIVSTYSWCGPAGSVDCFKTHIASRSFRTITLPSPSYHCIVSLSRSHTLALAQTTFREWNVFRVSIITRSKMKGWSFL